MNEQASDKGKKKEGRSPGYPAIDLPAALERVRTIMDKEKRNYANTATILNHWGYGSKSSQGFVVLAALKKFGLLEDEGIGDARKMKLTDLAWRILIDDREESKERLEAIQEAALRPHIHRQIWDEYPGGLPSDENLRFRLLMEWKPRFTSGAVDGFIAEFRRTIAFAKLEKGDILSGHEKDKTPPEEEPKMLRTEFSGTSDAATRIPAGEPDQPQSPGTRKAKLWLSDKEWAEIEVSYPLSAEAWNLMKQILDLYKRGLGVPEDSKTDNAN
jgi:hypothetical protein